MFSVKYTWNCHGIDVQTDKNCKHANDVNIPKS